MRKSLIVAVLCFSFCSPLAFAGDVMIRAGHVSSTAMLDASSTDSGPIGAIINAIHRADDWIQRNLW